MEEISSRALVERRARPQEQLNCPRCNSTNTKFCYYNNYSLTQPRYFCKTCRRYWTNGGSLRNVPVGGGSRKNKRPILTTPSSTTSKLPDLNPPTQLSHFSYSQNPKIHEGQDLNLAFPTMQDYHPISHHQYVEVPKIENTNTLSSSASTSSHHLSALELLRTGINASRGLNTFIPVPVPDSNTMFSSGFPFQELKPSIGFSVHHEHGNGYGSVQGVQENGDNQNKEQVNSNGYWNGMFGGGSW